MNEQFNKLSQEKQLRIINAALEVFAKSDYKRAATDEIARKAEISKGALFYYFHNKKELYLSLFDYCRKVMEEQVIDDEFTKITDFFEACLYATKKKVALLKRTPYIMDFSVRAFYSQKEPVSNDVADVTQKQLDGIFETFFSKIDLTKFKADVNPKQIYNMLIWMSDGYIHDKKQKHQPIDLDDIVKEFKTWIAMLKAIAYKEEYINGCYTSK